MCTSGHAGVVFTTLRNCSVVLVNYNTLSFNISERIFCFNSPILKLRNTITNVGNRSDWELESSCTCPLSLGAIPSYIYRKSLLEFELTYIFQDHCVN